MLVFHRSSFEYSRRAEHKNTLPLGNNEPKTQHQTQQSDKETGLPHYMQISMITTVKQTGEKPFEVENMVPTAR